MEPIRRPSATLAARRSGAPALTAPPLDYTYDGTFEGLLTVLFSVYDGRAAPNSIQPEATAQTGLFAQSAHRATDEALATRVWDGLLKTMDPEARARLYHVFLSEDPDRELLIFRYVDLALRAGRDISENYTAADVRRVQRLAQQMFREKHRMEAFVRFEKTTDIVQFENPAGAKSTDISATVLDEREPLFKLLWQSYFDHVNIPERKNMKLHRRHIPLRYWKYLSEKQPRELRFEPIQNKRPIAGKEISAGLRQLPE